MISFFSWPYLLIFFSWHDIIIIIFYSLPFYLTYFSFYSDLFQKLSICLILFICLFMDEKEVRRGHPREWQRPQLQALSRTPNYTTPISFSIKLADTTRKYLLDNQEDCNNLNSWLCNYKFVSLVILMVNPFCFATSHLSNLNITTFCISQLIIYSF